MNINPNKPADAQEAPKDETGAFDIRHLSQQQLAQLGVSQIAYVRPIETSNGVAFAIHAADGTPMALADNQEVAIAAIRQHEMMPALVH
ncbi:MAG: DUF1150 domain-containing protein [Alphaproteobacteria bacterium]|nr:DUF1150 domain-containing protein [Alphaproteobacteria bacterium]